MMLCFYAFMFRWSLPAFFFCWQDSEKTYVCFFKFLMFFYQELRSIKGDIIVSTSYEFVVCRGSRAISIKGDIVSR
jgi:hypothetical protein